MYHAFVGEVSEGTAEKNAANGDANDGRFAKFEIISERSL